MRVECSMRAHGRSIRAVTLLELLVCLVLVSVVLAAISAALNGGFFLLKQSEHKARALSVASQQMTKYLAKAYSKIPDTGSEYGNETFGVYSDGVTYLWNATFAAGLQSGPTASSKKIPFKNITVVCSYNETDFLGNPLYSRDVILKNVKVYPWIHSDSVTYKPTSKTVLAPYIAAPGFVEILHDPLVLNFDVPKTLVVTYSVAIGLRTAAGIEAGDSINTRLKIADMSGNVRYEGVITQTPMLSQPFINNVVALPNIQANKNYIVNVEWRAADARNNNKAYLKALELSVLAYEAK